MSDISSGTTEMHLFATVLEIHSLLQPVDLHWAMARQPINAQNHIVAAQGQHLEVGGEFDPLRTLSTG